MAILYVVLSHLGNNGYFLLPIPHDYIGKVGVWIFFVLSAFLLTSRFYEELQREVPLARSLLTYFIQRVFRIYPLLIFAIALHFLAGNLNTIDVIENLLLVEGYREHWAIPVEFKYYFIVPVVALAAHFFPRRLVIWALVAGVLASLISGVIYPTSVFSISLSLLPKLAPFLIGSIAALLMERGVPAAWQLQSKSSIAQFAPLAALLVLTALCRAVSMNWTPTLASPWSAWIAVGMSVAAGAIFYAALRGQLLHSFFSSRFMVFLGEVSFSLYLLHMFVIQFMKAHAVGYPPVVLAWAILILAIAFASVSYWLIERPGIRVGKFLSERVRAHMAPPSHQPGIS